MGTDTPGHRSIRMGVLDRTPSATRPRRLSAHAREGTWHCHLVTVRADGSSMSPSWPPAVQLMRNCFCIHRSIRALAATILLHDLAPPGRPAPLRPPPLPLVEAYFLLPARGLMPSPAPSLPRNLFDSRDDVPPGLLCIFEHFSFVILITLRGFPNPKTQQP